MSANESQVGGAHYQSGYQHWDFVQDCLGGLYMEGCITKYISRWRKKNGLQDLEKALHYCQKLIELVAGEEGLSGFGIPDKRNISRFCRENSLGVHESRIMFLAASWEDMHDLLEMEKLIKVLMAEANDVEHFPV